MANVFAHLPAGWCTHAFCFYKVARRSINDVLIIFCEVGGYPRSFCFGVRLQSSRCCGGPCGTTRLPHLQSNDVCSAHCIDATVRHRAVGRGCAPGIQSLLAWRSVSAELRGVHAHVLGWPFPPSASASVFCRCFFRKRFFPGNRCIKRKLTQFSAFSSRKMNFRMLTLFFCTWLPPPNSNLKPPGRCPIPHLIFRKQLPATAVVKTTAVISAVPLRNPLAA